MIDMHIHCVPPNLPGVGSLSPILDDTAENVARALREQMRAGGIDTAFAMGAWKSGEGDPLGINRTLEIAAIVPGLHAIGIADPERTDRAHLDAVEKLLAVRRVVALKAYLGYVHYFPADPGYRPYYELAEQYKTPFIFHTGDTYSPYAKLKFAHPMLIDELAVDHPKVRFVIAHVGNPWMMEAAQVVYKNLNVWVDLSGLIVGNEKELADPSERERIDEVADHLRKAFRYAERPNRFLYGSDWPLAPMEAYRDFIRDAIPATCHQSVFAENARVLFSLGR